ncbi:MAG TPA: HNH endonuclease [Marmoricola sp.]
MKADTIALDESAVLSSARRARAAANAAEAQVLADALRWAHLHPVTDLEDAATWMAGRGVDSGIPLGGAGCPLVSEFAVAELASALGISAESGRNLVAHVLELAHRLPRIWARVQDGSLPAWRARRVAEQTLILTPEAADHVDRQLAPFAHRTGPAQTERLVEEAIARFMPGFAAERRERAADQRHFDIDHNQVSFAGTARVHGELDLGAVDPSRDAGGQHRGGRGREVVLFVHLSEDALRSHDANAPVWLENAGGQLLTAGQVADWCGRPDTAKVTAKPVIDLNQAASVDAYKVPAWLAERVRLRDRTCVHPYCNRPARGCDLDHIVPFDDGGSTSLDNLACLCRLHHRMKTHGGWTYQMLLPGVFLWHSPHGHTWIRDASGTTDLTSDAAEPSPEPPHRRTS